MPVAFRTGGGMYANWTTFRNDPNQYNPQIGTERVGETYHITGVIQPIINDKGAFPLSARVFINGVEVKAIKEDQSPFKRVYDPGHPDADEQGYVQMPNVDIVEEMVDMISAARAYEANVTAINAVKSMAMKALEIGK